MTVRGRIYLRKQLKREFTTAELSQELGLHRKYDITPEEVDKAFLRGEEVSEASDEFNSYLQLIYFWQSIAVWTMQCIGYDAGFQRNLAEKFSTFEPKPKDSRSKNSGGTKDAPATRQPKSKTGQKRKRRENTFSDSDGNMDGPASEDSDVDLEAEVPAHRGYGTRSRRL